MESTPHEPGEVVEVIRPTGPLVQEESRALATPADMAVARAVDGVIGGRPGTMADAALGRTAAGRVGGEGDLRDRGNGSGSAGETPTDADFGLSRRRPIHPEAGA
jgi:hypothetical protein